MKVEHIVQFIGDYCSALIEGSRSSKRSDGREAPLARHRRVLHIFESMEVEVLGCKHTTSLATLVALHRGLGEIIGELQAEFEARAGVPWSEQLHDEDELEPEDFDVLELLRDSEDPVVRKAIEDAEARALESVRRA